VIDAAAPSTRQEDQRLKPVGEIPFDAMRLILGRFNPICTMER
jgi:uncharacterized protein YbaA (DUF1428 family)